MSSDYICTISGCAYKTPSGYCGSTGGYATCQYRQLHEPKKTHGDWLRSHSDRELAAWAHRIETEGRAFGPRGFAYWLKWLRQEAEQ